MKKVPSDATSVAPLLISPPSNSPTSHADSLSGPVGDWTMVERMMIPLRCPRVGTHTPTLPGNVKAGVDPSTARGVGAAVPRVAPCRVNERRMAARIPHLTRSSDQVAEACNDQDHAPRSTPQSSTGAFRRVGTPRQGPLCDAAGARGAEHLPGGIANELRGATCRNIVSCIGVITTAGHPPGITTAQPRSHLVGPSPIVPGPQGRGT